MVKVRNLVRQTGQAAPPPSTHRTTLKAQTDYSRAMVRNQPTHSTTSHHPLLTGTNHRVVNRHRLKTIYNIVASLLIGWNLICEAMAAYNIHHNRINNSLWPTRRCHLKGLATRLKLCQPLARVRFRLRPLALLKRASVRKAVHSP